MPFSPCGRCGREANRAELKLKLVPREALWNASIFFLYDIGNTVRLFLLGWRRHILAFSSIYHNQNGIFFSR